MAFQTVGVRAVVEGVGQYLADIDKLTGRTNSAFESVAQKVGGSMTRAGGALTAGVTLPIIGLGAAATKMGFDFSQTMTNIATLTNVPKESIDGLRETIFKLAHETAKTPAELGAGAYFILSAGFQDAADAANILEVAAKQSAIGMGSVEVTARTTAGLLKAYGAESSEAAKFGDMMTATVKEGAAEASEMATAFANVVPFAAQLGVGFDVVGGAMAQMTNQFFSADEAGTALNQLFTQLISPSDQLKGVLGEMGFTVEGLIAGLKTDAVGTLTALSSKAEESGNTVTLFADNVRAARAFVSAFGANAADTTAIIDRVGNSTGALNESMKTLNESDTQKIKVAINDVKIALTQLGIVLLPIIADVAVAVKPMIEAFGKMVEIFNKLPGPVKTGIIAFVALLAALGPILLIVGTMITSIGAIAGAISTLVVVAGPLLAVLIPLAPIILAVVAAAAALAIVAYLVYKNWDTIRAFFDDLPGKIMGAVSGIKDFLVEHWKSIVTAVLAVVFPPGAGMFLLATHWGKVKTKINKAIDGIKEALVKNWKKALQLMLLVLFPIPFLVVKHFDKMKDGVLKVVSDMAKGVVKFFKDLAADVERIVRDLTNKVIDFFASLPGRLAGALSNLWQTVTGAFESVKTTVLNTVASLIQGVVDFFTSLPGRIVSAMGNVAGALIGVGTQLVGGLLNGIQQRAGDVLAFFVGLPGQIANAMGDVLGVLFQKGVDLIQGLVNGILSVDIPNPLDLLPDDLPIPGAATGGVIRRTGLYKVGEQGPEMVMLPGNAVVLPTSLTRAVDQLLGTGRMIGGGPEPTTTTGGRGEALGLKTGAISPRSDAVPNPKLTAPDSNLLGGIIKRLTAGVATSVDALQLMRMGLGDLGHKVLLAVSGQQAMDRIGKLVAAAAEAAGARPTRAPADRPVVQQAAMAAAAPQVSMPMAVTVHAVDWLAIREAIHREVDNVMTGTASVSVRQGAVIPGSVG